MSNLITRTTRKKIVNALFVAGLLVLTISGTRQAAADNAGDKDVRTSITGQVLSAGRSVAAPSDVSVDEYEPLVTSGSRASSMTRGGAQKPGAGSSVTRSPRNDFWVFAADVVLFDDDDGDGYYHGIDLLFDADTIYSAVKVYAVVYLSQNLGPWNEYGMTEDFWIHGTSGDDEYGLVTELVSGYPRGDYDLLIEIFDARDNSFLASSGPDETSALSFLPLEDSGRDEPFVRTQVAVSHGGGGASDAWTIGFLLLVLVVGAARKIWRHRNDALVRIDTPAPCWQQHPRSGRRSF